MPVYRQLSGGGTFRTGLKGNRLVAKRQGEREARNFSGERLVGRNSRHAPSYVTYTLKNGTQTK